MVIIRITLHTHCSAKTGILVLALQGMGCSLDLSNASSGQQWLSMIRPNFPPEVLAALSSQAGMNFSGIKPEMDSSGFLRTGNTWEEESRLLVLSHFYTPL